MYMYAIFTLFHSVFLLLNYFYNSCLLAFLILTLSSSVYLNLLFLIPVFSFRQDELVLVGCFDLSLLERSIGILIIVEKSVPKQLK